MQLNRIGPIQAKLIAIVLYTNNNSNNNNNNDNNNKVAMCMHKITTRITITIRVILHTRLPGYSHKF